MFACKHLDFETIPIQRALDGLRQRRQLSLGNCISQLDRVRVRVQAARILQAYAPERYQQLWVEHGAMLYLENQPGDTTILEQAAIEAAQQLVPTVDDFMLEDQILNLDGGYPLEFAIHPMGVGYVSEDDGMEYGNFSEIDGLLVFIKYIDNGLDDLEYWYQAGEYFGWPEGLAPEYTLAECPVNYYDMNELNRQMRQRGLLGFWVAVEIATQQTDNLLYDYSPYDEWENLPRFSPEGLAELIEAWQTAQPIKRKYEKALQRLEKNKASIYRRLMRCWNASAVYPGEDGPRAAQVRQSSSQTLAEMWMAQS